MIEGRRKPASKAVPKPPVKVIKKLDLSAFVSLNKGLAVNFCLRKVEILGRRIIIAVKITAINFLIKAPFLSKKKAESAASKKQMIM